jgi:hypothetical protein
MDGPRSVEDQPIDPRDLPSSNSISRKTAFFSFWMALATKLQTSFSWTSSELSLRATTMAGQRRVYSSITVGMRNRLPSSVQSCMKSHEHTWLGRSGVRRTHDPSLSHKHPLFFGLSALAGHIFSND